MLIRRLRPWRARPDSPVWLLDLDHTLHNAHEVFGSMHGSMQAYIQERLGVTAEEAAALRRRYWFRYGATLLGLVRHHGVDGHHFLEATHRLEDLEARVTASTVDLAALARLPGLRIVLTNAPRRYALRVLDALNITQHFHAVLSVEDMHRLGHWRPKPDRRTLRMLTAALGVRAHRCVLVDDALVNCRAAAQVGWTAVRFERWVGPGPTGSLGAGRPNWLAGRTRALGRLGTIAARRRGT